jgi:hypothetical protein
MRLVFGVGIAIFALAILAACSGGSTPQELPTATSGSAVPSLAVSAAATSTVATPTAAASKGSPTDSAGVLDGLKARDLPIGEVKVYTAEDDLNQLLGRPRQYTAKASFHDTRLPADPEFAIEAGGSVEFFASGADAKRRADYLKVVTQSFSFAVEYAFLKGNALLRVSRALTPDQAAAYESALTALMQP